MNEHTKGKAELAWEDGKHGVICGESGGKLIAIVGNDRDDGKNDERKANAKRIVHTWNCHDELVEALEEIKKHMGGYCDIKSDNCSSCKIYETVEKALTKANEQIERLQLLNANKQGNLEQANALLDECEELIISCTTSLSNNSVHDLVNKLKARKDDD